MGADLQSESFFMPGTQRRSRNAFFPGKFFTESRSIKELTAYPAMNKIKRDDFIPQVCQHALKFNRLLGAYPPAIAAASAARHVVHQLSFSARIYGFNRIGRTILQTCKTSVALVVYLEIGHLISPHNTGRLANPRKRHPVGICESNRFRFAEIDALRLTSAQIAFENRFTGPVEPDGAEGAGSRAHLT